MDNLSYHYNPGTNQLQFVDDALADGELEHFKPNLLSETDYYAFGSEVKERSMGGGYKFGFNGQENDKETGTQDYGMRIYNPELGRFLSVDPKKCIYEWQSPYAYFKNCPISKSDFLGLGDFYDKKGKHLGSDGKTNDKGNADDKVYVEESVKLNEKGLVESAKGSQELSISHSDFKKFAGHVSQEDASTEEVSFAIASMTHNYSTLKGASLHDLLKTNYFTSPSTLKRGVEDQSRAAVINALTGRTDYSNGADHWDGFALAGKGFSHIKARTQGIEISYELFEQLKTIWPDSKLKAFSGSKYENFSKNFSAGIHKATEGDNKGRVLYQATPIVGNTLFWKKNDKLIISETKIQFDGLGKPTDTYIQDTNPNEGYNWKHY